MVYAHSQTNNHPTLEADLQMVFALAVRSFVRALDMIENALNNCIRRVALILQRMMLPPDLINTILYAMHV